MNFARVTIYNKHLSVTRVQQVEAYSLLDLFSDKGKSTSIILFLLLFRWALMTNACISLLRDRADQCTDATDAPPNPLMIYALYKTLYSN